MAVGITEIKGTVSNLIYVAEALVDAADNGYDIGDAWSLARDDKVRDALVELSTSLSEVRREVTDLDWQEVMQLGQFGLDRVASLLRK